MHPLTGLKLHGSYDFKIDAMRECPLLNSSS